MKIRNELGIRVLATVFTGCVKLLFHTLRLQFRVETPGTSPYDPQTSECFLYCVWHDSVVIPAFAAAHRSTSALTSRHADGSFVAAVLRCLKILPIRGSTGRLGRTAYSELLSAAAAGHVVITPDGPRGPARQANAGIVQLASRTGRAIVPTAYAAQRAWRISGSWTYLLIPCPFTRVSLLAGTPIRVPPDLTRTQLQPYLQLVQSEMDRLSAQLDGELQGTSRARCRDGLELT